MFKKSLSMLLRFLKEEEKILKILSDYVRRRKNSLSPFLSNINRRILFEGNRIVLKRESGTEELIEMEQIESTIKFEQEKIEEISLEEYIKILFEKINKMTEKFIATEIAKLIEKLEKAVEKSGNVVSMDSENHSLPEIILKVIKKIEIEFDENKKPILPSILLNPITAQKLKLEEQLKKFEEDPNLKRKWEEIIFQKWEEWREREASRRLVG